METEPVFLHIRVVMGIILGLSITTLLKGLAQIIEHPQRRGCSALHLCWVVWTLVSLVTFWWWEFRLVEVHRWTFEIYLFVITYCATWFLLCALLFPDSMLDYTSYEDFFYSRRGWFFGLLATTYLLDVVDTLLKGPEHFARFGNEYLFRTPVFVVLCIAAIVVHDRRFHIAFVAAALIYQISFILRLFDTIV